MKHGVFTRRKGARARPGTLLSFLVLPLLIATGCKGVELCDDGIDNNKNGTVDCQDDQCLADVICDAPNEAANIIEEGFTGILGSSLSNDAQTVFFTGYNSEEVAAVFSVPASGGDAVEIFSGDPLNEPLGLALDPGGETLFIADSTSDENGDEEGAVFTLSIEGDTPEPLNIESLVSPSVLAISDDGETLFLGATDVDTGVVGIYTLPASGGASSLLIELTEPAAIALVGDDVLVVDADGEDGRASLQKISADGGEATLLASNLKVEYPAGISSTPDNTTALITALDPATNNASAVFAVPMEGGQEAAPIDFGFDFASLGSLTRARFSGVWVTLDLDANVDGGMFRLE